MILNMIIVASALVALLGLVDFFLVERQKIWLETRAIAAWNEIDEMTKFPLTEWWQGPALAVGYRPHNNRA